MDYDKLLEIKRIFDASSFESYPIYGADVFGEFRIDSPPKWVEHLESIGIRVSMGAWGVTRKIDDGVK